MTDYNHWAGIGRLTRDAELKYLTSGTALCNFSIAVNRSIPPREGSGEDWKNEASFIDVQLWGKAAESKAPKLVKGKQVLVSGSIRQDRWEQDGQQRSKLYIVAESIQPLADGKKASEDAPNTNPPAPKTPAIAGDFSDDIPF
jgi:single-strand DNA-binding protein